MSHTRLANEIQRNVRAFGLTYPGAPLHAARVASCLRRALVLVMALGLTAPVLAACDSSASAGAAIAADKKHWVGNWSGSGSTLVITDAGQLTSHILDSKGASADVSGQIQAISGSQIVVNAGGATVNIPVVSEPKQVNGKSTLVLAGVEGGSVTLVKN